MKSKTNKRKINEDVVEFFDGEPQAKRAYDMLTTQFNDEQIRSIDWEMVMMALQAKVTDTPVREYVDNFDSEKYLKELDNELKNIGY